MITEYTVRSDWDREGERFTVLYCGSSIGPAVKVCVCVCTQWKMLSKCDLLTPSLRIEVYNVGDRDKWVWFSVTKCNKVWNCVTI